MRDDTLAPNHPRAKQPPPPPRHSPTPPYTQGYDTPLNTAPLNHALCSFLWRLVLPEHLNLEPMLYQLSALRLFHRALGDAKLRGRPEFKELLLLATRVTRGLFARLVPGKGADGGKGGRKAGEGGETAGAEAGEKDAEGKEREERIKSVVAGMTFVELLFWSSFREVEQMRDNYHLGDR